MKRLFMGKNDPDGIILERVFPRSNLVFSTPLEEIGRHHRVIVEGDEPLLEEFEYRTEILKETKTNNGRWVAIVEGELLKKPCLWIVYEPKDRIAESFNLLVFNLREDLVKICNLKLCPVSHVTVTKGHTTVFNNPAPLPKEIGNGLLEIAPAIVSPTIRLM